MYFVVSLTPFCVFTTILSFRLYYFASDLLILCVSPFI